MLHDCCCYCFYQFWSWIKKALPGGINVYMLGLAQFICWAISKGNIFGAHSVHIKYDLSILDSNTIRKIRRHI
jgi:hypothetical protein